MEVVKVEIVDGAVNEKEKVDDGEAIGNEDNDLGNEDDKERETGKVDDDE